MSTPSDAWAGERVTKWLRQAEQLERQLSPVSDVLFTAAELHAGERVLDVGCGAGPTTHRAASAVGTAGAVTGLDVSKDMLDAAAAGAPVDGDGAAIEWLEADVTTWTPPAETYDVVISRFGVMFFSDPDAAFANLAAATRPGGRLAMAVWPRRDECDLFEVPLQAALRARQARGLADPDHLPDDTGAFSLCDPDATRGLLERTGWTEVDVTTHDLSLRAAGGAGPAEAARAAADVGATRVALDGVGADVLQEATDAIAEALVEHVDDHGEVVLGARVLVVTASRQMST